MEEKLGVESVITDKPLRFHFCIKIVCFLLPAQTMHVLLIQVLYLEAHAVGISATGIGCFFDDPVHEILGLTGSKFQSLYHFTVGGPVLDKRIMSLPAYPGPGVDA
ncbi:uncharacterized protein LOC143580619 [Bidens hawaiensis]|uniref:uncharacterized protein LOC143580619 n=1 Tax=Bidens hawaiensis TaxID=980011 RepID=UPI0040499A36